jgi:hypothetical protein
VRAVDGGLLVGGGWLSDCGGGRLGILLCSRGGGLALGQALGGEAEVFLQRDGGITLAVGVYMAALAVALLLLVAVGGGVPALCSLDLAGTLDGGSWWRPDTGPRATRGRGSDRSCRRPGLR